MKQLFFKSSFLLLLCLLTNPMLADDVTIFGKLSISQDNIAVPGFPVNISSADGNFVADAITDDEGNYTATIELPTGTVTDLNVEVLDLCTGEIITQIFSSSLGTIEANFLLCNDLFDLGCQAAFSYAPGAIDPLGFPIDFTDNSTGAIDSWSWDFGDGNTSDEQNPTHVYAEEGSYLVSLSISGDSCDNIYQQLIIIGDNGGGDPCDCFNDFTPVCVTDPTTGDFLVFPNACFAECEGYTEADFTDCDFGGGNNGDCYAAFSFAQDTDDASIVNFTDQSSDDATSWSWDFGDGGTSSDQNPSHDYADFGIYTVNLTITTDSCTSTYSELLCIYENGNGGGLDSCNCELTFEPVCVTDSTGVLLTFPNACFAECFGFTADQFEDCGNGGGDPCDCTFDFDPVCVLDATTGDIHTFPNACYAECEGYTEADFVECDNGGGNPCDCTFDFEPVCVMDSTGVIIPFPSACFAECEGYTEADFVDCGNGGGDPCNCTFDFDPVCVLDAATGDIHTFPNACFAECEGYTEADFVECDNGGGNPCDCTFDFEPVCVMDSTGVIIPFPSACFAECEGYTEADFVDCGNGGGDPCDCTFDFDPVCVLDAATGDIITFPNACYAECEGYAEADFVACDNGGGDPCDCTFDFDPVCVTDSISGMILTFPNACYAECEGYTEADFVDCGIGGNPCDCPEYFDPVCVLDANGNVITFDNECFAACEGFNPSEFVDCNDGTDPCNCTFEFDPVCVLDSLTGEELTIPNACLAECLGYTEADFVECTDIPWTGCDCTFEIDPVCVIDADGNIQTFLNACYAECEGYTEDDFEEDCGVDPDPTGCGCDITFDPVCTTDDNGELLVFLNTCWAECAGVDANDLSDCNLDGNNMNMDGGVIFALMASPLNTNDQVTWLTDVTAFPNPVVEELNLQLTTDESLELTISIVSITGRELYSTRVVSDKGRNNFKLPASDLTQGIYFARIQAENDVISLKFVK